MEYKLDKLENESDLEYAKRLVYGKLVDKTIKADYEELSELIFGLGKKFNSSEVRKRMYGMKRVFEMEEVKEENSKEIVKCIIMGDLHIPYEREDVLTEIRKHNDVDYIVLTGDIIDCESCSSFESLERLSVEQELVYAHDFISKVNKIIDPSKTKIICIKGNHEERYTRDIMKMQQKELQKMLNPNLLEMIQDGFAYYEKGKKIKYEPIENFVYIDSWKAKLFNNLIVCHPKNFSNIGGKISEQIAEYLLNQEELDKGDMVIFGHTHKFSILKNNRRQGVFVIENGCMCKEMEYASTGKLGYTKQNYCYTYLEFKDGEKIDVNNVKVIHL